MGEAPLYGETGADLFTEMVAKYDLAKFGQPMELTFPLSALDVPLLFDPGHCDELLKRCAGACFLHLFNETWRRSGIPSYLGPPEGSLMDHLLRKHGFDVLRPRIELADLKRWTAYLTLHEEFQAGQRAFRLANEALRSRVGALEQENAELRSSPKGSTRLRNRSIFKQMRRVLNRFRRSYGTQR